MEPRPEEIRARFVIGIDLGTTNSAVAFVDTHCDPERVQIFPVAQLIAPGQVEARETLPSFHHDPAAHELDAATGRLPWDTGQARGWVVGVLARELGANAPGRLIASAKSWLCHTGVDRTADLLPWHGAADVARISPAKVCARYLDHLREAWNFSQPGSPMETQDVIVTIPASFDEIARELTVAAARQAGLPRVILIEEPQAAFYAWAGDRPSGETLAPGQRVLVCDIGGGTTDFTLIETRPGIAAMGARPGDAAVPLRPRAGSGAGGTSAPSRPSGVADPGGHGPEEAGVRFHRVAVGDHLLLGGDNLDLALAHHLEGKLGARLDPRLWGLLLRRSQQAKEVLLGPGAPERWTISLPAAQSARLVAGARTIEVTREEVVSLLVDGFLPRVSFEEKPLRRTSGFQEFGLPYAADPAITRHLAAFLNVHGSGRPDAVLFNGGFFKSPALRERLLHVLDSWFPGGAAVKTLTNERLDLAVALGAARYGLARRGVGMKISGGLARSYYLGIQHEGKNAALCLVPASLEEGQEIDLPQPFDLILRRPVEFPLYVSSARTTDATGEVVALGAEQMTALPPIRTALKASVEGADSVKVRLHARLTEIGTLEVWCAEVHGKRQWKLPFDIRAAARTDVPVHDALGERAGFVDSEIVQRCRRLVCDAFSAIPAAADVEGLVKRLEAATAMARAEWPPSLLREYWEELLPLEPTRERGPIFEARWLGLLGFSLRPGHGFAADEWRVARTWRVFEKKVVHSRSEFCRAEWWILWRRIAAGLSGGQQRALAAPLLAELRKHGGASWGGHETAEIWRLLGSLEWLEPGTKVELGERLLAHLADGSAHASRRAASLWALGRLGARAPLFGPLNTVVPFEAAESWIDRLLSLPVGGEDAAFALMQLSRLTGDRFRDVSEPARSRVLDHMRQTGVPVRLVELVRAGGDLQGREQDQVFGENLPLGLTMRTG